MGGHGIKGIDGFAVGQTALLLAIKGRRSVGGGTACNGLNERSGGGSGGGEVVEMAQKGLNALVAFVQFVANGLGDVLDCLERLLGRHVIHDNAQAEATETLGKAQVGVVGNGDEVAVWMAGRWGE